MEKMDKGVYFFSSLCDIDKWTSKGFFAAKRGLRQGDPLSPFLFTIVVDTFSKLMKKIEEKEIIKGFGVGNGQVSVSHLQFANDTILFCEAAPKFVLKLRSIMRSFERISGLRINLEKCKVAVLNLEDGELSVYARLLGCEQESWPIKYLGLPLGGNPRALSFWQPVLEKMSKRLSSWKRNYISLGGRIELIKSTLSNLPTYYLSIFKAPSKVIQSIEKMQRDFIWEPGDKRKDHLLRWDMVCKPLVSGCLGLGNISLRNDALLAKWLW